MLDINTKKKMDGCLYKIFVPEILPWICFCYREIDYTTGIFQSIGFKEFHSYLILSEDEKNSEKGKLLFDEGLCLVFSSLELNAQMSFSDHSCHCLSIYSQLFKIWNFFSGSPIRFKVEIKYLLKDKYFAKHYRAKNLNLDYFKKYIYLSYPNVTYLRICMARKRILLDAFIMKMIDKHD